LPDSSEAAHKFVDEGECWRKIQAPFEQRTDSILLEAVEGFAGPKFRAIDSSQLALYKSFGAGALSGIPCLGDLFLLKVMAQKSFEGGVILIPTMIEQGYPPSYATGITAGNSLIGPRASS
jgi:hypothetical protein